MRAWRRTSSPSASGGPGRHIHATAHQPPERSASGPQIVQAFRRRAKHSSVREASKQLALRGNRAATEEVTEYVKGGLSVAVAQRPLLLVRPHPTHDRILQATLTSEGQRRLEAIVSANFVTASSALLSRRHRGWSRSHGEADAQAHCRGDVRGHGAGASVDSELDDAIVRPAARSPVRSWSRRWAEAGRPSAMGDVLEVWRSWAPDVRGRAVDARTSWPMTARRRRQRGCSNSHLTPST
jgi:hypothetical protein